MDDDYKNTLRVLIEYEMIEQPCGYCFKQTLLRETVDKMMEVDGYCDKHCGNEIEDMMNCWCKFAKLVKENEERRNKS